MTTTTGTSISSYLDWLKREIGKKDFGEVSIRFKIFDGQVVDVRKESVDCDHYQVKPLNGNLAP